jgi:hypothetical protein
MDLFASWKKIDTTHQKRSPTTFVYSCAATAKCIIGLRHFFSPVKILPYSCCWSLLACSPDPVFICITCCRDILFGILHSPGQKQYSNTSPSCCGVIEFLVPFPLFILVFRITSPAHKVLYYTPPFHQCCWWGTSPITIYVHSIKKLAMDHTMKCC